MLDSIKSTVLNTLSQLNVLFILPAGNKKLQSNFVCEVPWKAATHDINALTSLDLKLLSDALWVTKNI